MVHKGVTLLFLLQRAQKLPHLHYALKYVLQVPVSLECNKYQQPTSPISNTRYSIHFKYIHQHTKSFLWPHNNQHQMTMVYTPDKLNAHMLILPI